VTSVRRVRTSWPTTWRSVTTWPGIPAAVARPRVATVGGAVMPERRRLHPDLPFVLALILAEFLALLAVCQRWGEMH